MKGASKEPDRKTWTIINDDDETEEPTDEEEIN